jgi:hypothetical protein
MQRGGGLSLDAFDGWAYATNWTLGWKIKLGFQNGVKFAIFPKQNEQSIYVPHKRSKFFSEANNTFVVRILKETSQAQHRVSIPFRL